MHTWSIYFADIITVDFINKLACFTQESGFYY